MGDDPTSDESPAQPAPEPAPASEPEEWPEPAWPDVTKPETRSRDPEADPNYFER